jgi:hypothetical protein
MGTLLQILVQNRKKSVPTVSEVLVTADDEGDEGALILIPAES